MAANDRNKNTHEISCLCFGGMGKNILNSFSSKKDKHIKWLIISDKEEVVANSKTEFKFHTNEAAELYNELADSRQVLMFGGLGRTSAFIMPAFAQQCHREHTRVIAIDTMPFTFDVSYCLKQAENTLADLEKEIDAVLIFPNDDILCRCQMKDSFRQYMEKMNKHIFHCFKALSMSPNLVANFSVNGILTFLREVKVQDQYFSGDNDGSRIHARLEQSCPWRKN